MGHHHHHPVDSQSLSIRLFAAMFLNFVITFVELVGGILTGSLSLISDALHNFSDGIALVISYIAIRIGNSSSTEQHTFGLKRAEIIAAIINASVLIAISVYLFKESWERFFSAQEIHGGWMSGIAFVGLVANLLGVWLLRQGSKTNLNLKSAYLHLLSDAVSSLGVILGGLCIYFWGLTWIDPLLTVIIALYVLWESLKIVLDATKILMMAAPGDVSLSQIKQEVEAIEGVKNIHHAHLWMLNEHNVHFEAHIEVGDIDVKATSVIKAAIVARLNEIYPIHHTTLQFECDDCDSKSLIA